MHIPATTKSHSPQKLAGKDEGKAKDETDRIQNGIADPASSYSSLVRSAAAKLEKPT
jgi:hypothetical protein